MIQKVTLMAHDTTSAAVRCIQRHGDVLRAGLGMAANVTKLENLGKDTEGRLLVDPKHSVILAVVKARDAFAASVNTFKEELKHLCPEEASHQEMEDESVRQTKLRMIELWNTTSAHCFQDLIDSEVVMDCVSRICVTTKEKLQSRMSSAQVVFDPVTKEHDWKRGLAADASFPTVLEHAVEKLKNKIQEKKNLKHLVDSASEEKP